MQHPKGCRIDHETAGHIYTFNNVECTTNQCPGGAGRVDPPGGVGDIRLQILDQNNNVVDTHYPDCSVSRSGCKTTWSCNAFPYTGCPTTGKIKARIYIPATPGTSLWPDDGLMVDEPSGRTGFTPEPKYPGRRCSHGYCFCWTWSHSSH